MKGPVYKIDPLPWCDFKHILGEECILGTPATKNMKFWKELKKKKKVKTNVEEKNKEINQEKVYLQNSW